jgi:hypothetical protein
MPDTAWEHIKRLTKERQADPLTPWWDALREACDSACTCGGDGPGDCCPACEVWHLMRGQL